MTADDRYWQAKKVTLLGALVNALLGVIKLVGGLSLHSHALVADGIHSFSDLITDFMVLFAAKFSSQGADVTHPYGHQRIETAATFLLALLLIFAGIGIAWDATLELLKHTHTMPGWFALPIALGSIIANEALYHYTRRTGLRIQSPLIIANAWHHRSDAGASIVVALGILGSLLGYLYFDAIAAVIVGFLIVKMGVGYGWNSVSELVDTGVDAQTLKQITLLIDQVEGVKKIHQLRTRLMGGDIYIDVHILVDPFISVSEGHYIAQHVHRHLMWQLPRIKDVIVHVDPEDDEISSPSLHLHNRRQLHNGLLKEIQEVAPGVEFWTVHYLDGRLLIDLIYDDTANTVLITDTIKNVLPRYPEIKEVRLYQRYGTITA